METPRGIGAARGINPPPPSLKRTIKGFPTPVPRDEPEAQPPSDPEFPDGDTVLHELEVFTPPDIPLSLPIPSPTPPVQVAKIVSVGPMADPGSDPPPAVAVTQANDVAMVRVTPPPPPGSGPIEPHSGESFIRPHPVKVDARLVLLNEPDSVRASSFRLLRDNLLTNKLPRVLAISSATMNEGKTTCSINLAIALAEQPPTRVLLMDANFFDPTLGRIFSIDATTPPAPGTDVPWLAPYRIAEVARGLHVAALVRNRGEAPPRFDSQWFDTLIGHLCSASYDHLILDAAALEGAPQVVQLVGIADATLLTVRSGATTARALRRAAEQIPKSKAIGIALIDGHDQS
jgi:Mrp family chromosome partitioning ATPase